MESSADLREADARMTFEAIAEKYGIAAVRDDSLDKDVGEPPSRYYTHEEADFEASHKQADKDLASLGKHLARWGS